MEKERYFIHFKGGLYKMLGIAQHSETLEEMVVYQALYGKHEIWVRPKTMFFDKIVRNGIKIDRFKEITEKEIYESYYATYQIVSFMNQYITQLSNVHLTTQLHDAFVDDLFIEEPNAHKTYHQLKDVKDLTWETCKLK